MLKLLVILGSSVILSACIIQKQAITYESIRFGSGGGFTGAVEGYKLHKNKLSKLEGSEILRVLSDEELATINNQIAAVESLTFDEPANMYRFIEISLSDQREMKFQWGINQEIPDKLQGFYDSLMSTVKQ